MGTRISKVHPSSITEPSFDSGYIVETDVKKTKPKDPNQSLPPARNSSIVCKRHIVRQKHSFDKPQRFSFERYIHYRQTEGKNIVSAYQKECSKS